MPFAVYAQNGAVVDYSAPKTYILKNLKVNGKITVLSNVSDVIVEGCEADCIVSYGSYVEIRENKVSGDVKLFDNECSLVAQNEVGGKISVCDSYNCSVILNKARVVIKYRCKNYIRCQSTACM